MDASVRAMSRVSRRQALAGFGGVSLAALIAACSGDDDAPTARVETSEGTTSEFDDAATCTQTAELTEGPFYFDVDRIRSDIREDRQGVELRLGVRVRSAPECKPVENAVVDIWHCDAEGSYSEPGETYCRGAQVTNRDGIVEFTTVYPGWYPGRTVHIHAKVHLDNQTVLTTQLFTTREYDDKVFARTPYAEDPGRDTFNEDDGIFDESLVMTLSDHGDGGGVLGVMTFDVTRA